MATIAKEQKCRFNLRSFIDTNTALIESALEIVKKQLIKAINLFGKNNPLFAFSYSSGTIFSNI